MYLKSIMFMFFVFHNMNILFAQDLPVSPCPRVFQYRFDGTEWFGLLTVPNPDFGQPLHLTVTLSMRGTPTANYLGGIQLLTRGQHARDAPVFYKINFPRSNFPPKLSQITTNNRVVCLGTTDHSIFLTQIQLEHTRKFTIMPEGAATPIQPPPPPPPQFPSPLLSPAAAGNMGFAGGHSASTSSIGMGEFSALPLHMAFDTKHIPLINIQQHPNRSGNDICGTIDERIHFQVLHKLSPPSPRHSDTMSMRNKDATYDDKVKADETSGENEAKDDVENLPTVGTSDIELPSESGFDNVHSGDSSTTINKPQPISRGAWPWLAAVYVNNLTSLVYHCGGTLVSTRIVISAAHCFHLYKQRYTANEVLVFLGRHNLKNWNEEDSVAAPVDDIFIHPEYKEHLSTYDADIAVLILKNKVVFNTFIRPACLWSGPTNLEYIEGEHAILVGWGVGGYNISRYSSTTTVPNILSTPIVSNDMCFEADSKFYHLSSNRTFCAGAVSPHKKQNLYRGPCVGDSGSGLMIFKKRRWTLRGIVCGTLPIQTNASKSSKIAQGCSINQYVIYTDVAKFLDWIFAFMV